MRYKVQRIRDMVHPLKSVFGRKNNRIGIEGIRIADLRRVAGAQHRSATKQCRLLMMISVEDS